MNPPSYGIRSWHLFFTGSIPLIALHNRDSLPHILRQPRTSLLAEKKILRQSPLSFQPVCHMTQSLYLRMPILCTQPVSAAEITDEARASIIFTFSFSAMLPRLLEKSNPFFKFF